MMSTAVERMRSPDERLAFARHFAKRAPTDSLLKVLQSPVAQALLQHAFQGSSPQVEEIVKVLDLIPLESLNKFPAQTTLTILNKSNVERITWLVNRYGDHPEIRRAISDEFAFRAQNDHRAGTTWLQALESSPLKDEGISRSA